MATRLTEWTHKSFPNLPLTGRFPFRARLLQRRRLHLSSEPDVLYAIGDVHGCLDQLKALEALIVEDAKSNAGSKLIVMLGDYIDRGPDSAAVLDHLLNGPPEGFYRVCLCGNHDQAFLDLLDKPGLLKSWLALGGKETLDSYGLNTDYLLGQLSLTTKRVVEEIRRAVPAAHLEALQRIPISLTTPSYFFAHAGARPGVAWEEQTDNDLMWIRDEFQAAEAGSFDRIVVHGHTIVRHPIANDIHVAVDTGAFLGRPLTAARLERGTVSFLSTADRPAEPATLIRDALPV